MHLAQIRKRPTHRKEYHLFMAQQTRSYGRIGAQKQQVVR